MLLKTNCLRKPSARNQADPSSNSELASFSAADLQAGGVTSLGYSFLLYQAELLRVRTLRGCCVTWEGASAERLAQGSSVFLVFLVVVVVVVVVVK